MQIKTGFVDKIKRQGTAAALLVHYHFHLSFWYMPGGLFKAGNVRRTNVHYL